MKFEKQVEEAKKKRLENRIIRDIVFISLGILFLIISIIVSYNNDKKVNSSAKTTTKIKETTKN